MTRPPRPSRRPTAVLVALLTLLVLPMVPASAVGTAQSSVVAAVPSTATPNINDGRVLAMAQVGNRIVVGGTFTSVTNRTGGQTYTRVGVFAFDPATGLVDPAFAPTLNGTVNTLLAVGTTQVYVGGTFTTVNGATHRNLAYLTVATGALVPGFRVTPLNGAVNDLALAGGRLYVGGVFSTANGVSRAGLVTLVPTTGAVDPYMTIDVAVNHNWDGTGARAAVGVSKLEITPDGSRLIVIGNFKLIEGLSRDQAGIVLLNVGGPVVDPNWRTTRYEPACFRNAFDTYVRDLDVAPDGSWFSIVATGGPNPGTLCDTATRWELSDTGSDVQPRWIADTGGDTLFSVAISGTAVYVGGHQRWMNNAGGRDYAAPGAVPRPGLAALDPRNGVPLTWNPARQPRGVGAQALLLTSTGLYVGSDTDYIGNVQYFRGRIAYFPLAGGTEPASQDTGTLPANVYLAGRSTATQSPTPGVLFRVNAGGPELAAGDGGPNWAADNGTSSPYRTSGSNAASYSAVPAVDATVPAGTPSALFDVERWDPGSKNDGAEMNWSFPIAAGTPVQVRLYFANRYPGTSSVGSRVFDIRVEGALVRDDFDIRRVTADQTGTMQAFDVVSDGTITIDFGHEVENPLINGIELVDTGATPSTEPAAGVNDLLTRFVDGDTVAKTQVTANADGITWSQVRGAFLIGGRAGGTLVYGWSDGNLYRRAVTGTTFGPPTLIDPYNDPFWSTIDTGSGQTYRGVKSAFYAQLPSVTGMFYAAGRVYYTLAGSAALYYRGFSTDSLIVGPDQYVAASSGWSDVQGMFVSGSQLYWASAADGALRRVAFTDGVPSGTATVVSGPAVDGKTWRSRALFLGPGDPPPPNQPPTAAFGSTCDGLACTFDATGSSDDDGSVVTWSWSFGDAAGGSGSTVAHTYAAAGTRTVTLTVTDNEGAQAQRSAQVAVGVVNDAPTAAFTVTCDGRTCTVDGTGSADSDGTVTGWAWSFGDGGTASGPVAQYTYPVAGSWPITLTVTDNVGATASTSATQEVSPNRVIRWRATATPFRGTGVTSASVTVPAEVQAADALVLVLTTNSAVTGTAPAGWTVSGTQAAGTAMTTRVWSRVATAGDAGGTVVVPLSGSAKVSLGLVAYSGTSSTNPVASFTGSADNGGTSHVTPAATAGADGLVLSLWADKGPSARSFTAPAGVSTRAAVSGVGNGDVATLFADGGTPVPAGPVGGLPATVGASSTRGVNVTVVLAPGT